MGYGPVRSQPLLQGILVNTDLTAETDARQAIVAHHPVYPLRLDLEHISGFFNCEYLHEGSSCFHVSHNRRAVFRSRSRRVLWLFFYCLLTSSRFLLGFWVSYGVWHLRGLLAAWLQLWRFSSTDEPLRDSCAAEGGLSRGSVFAEGKRGGLTL